MAKKYIVDLSSEELSYLESVTRKGKRKARTITRAKILIMTNEGYLDAAIASNLRVSISTVERTREKFVMGGLEYAIKDSPHPRRCCKLDGKPEAFLIATACSTPPGGRNRWTMKLLADKLVSLGMVDSVSDETVRQTLKKTRSNLG